MTDQSKLSGETRQVTRAAVLISIGNIISRALGLVREMAKSYFFGAGGAVSAFDVASQVPTMLYDQLVGGMLNSSLGAGVFRLCQRMMMQMDYGVC